MIKKILLNKYILAAVAGIILISSAFGARYYLERYDIQEKQEKGEKIEKFAGKEPLGEIILPSESEKEKKESETEEIKTESLPEEKKETVKAENGASVKEITFEIKGTKKAKKIAKAKSRKSKIKLPLNITVVKKGEGVYSAAFRIAEKMNFSREEFNKVWFESLVVIHGKVMSIEEAAVVPKGTKIICNKEKGYFILVLPKGGKLGTHKDLHDIYLAKGKTAPNWLKASIGLDKEISHDESEKIGESALFQNNKLFSNHANYGYAVPV